MAKEKGLKSAAVEPEFLKVGNNLLKVLWGRVGQQVSDAGIDVSAFTVNGQPFVFDASEVPKDLGKMGYFHDLLACMIEVDPSKVPGTEKNVSEYIRKVVAPRLGMRVVNDAAKVKQNALFQLHSNPNWTRLMANHNPPEVWKKGEEVRKRVAADPGWRGNLLADELTLEWDLHKVHGFTNPMFVLGHMHSMQGAGMPWSSRDRKGRVVGLPLPHDLMKHGCREVLKELDFDTRGRLKLGHLLIGSAGSSTQYGQGKGVVTLSNNSGSAGFPYTGLTKEQYKTIPFAPMSKRAVKSTVIKAEIYDAILPWLLAGIPDEGPLWDRMCQPNSVWNRKDATVNVQLAMLAEALRRKGFPLLSMLLPGRGIAIVATAPTLCELTVAQPIQWMIVDRDNRTFDQRTNRIRRSGMRSIVMATLAGHVQSVGQDAARWDLSTYPQEHAYEAATYMRMFDRHQDILVGAASLPAEWTQDHIDMLMRELSPGETADIDVVVPDPDGGSDRIETVAVTKVSVDVHKLIARMVSLTNGAPVRMGEFEWKPPLREYEVPNDIRNLMTPGQYHETDTLKVKVSGGRRSGSGLTSIGNTTMNGVITHGAYYGLKKNRRYKKLIAKRAKAFGLPNLGGTQGSGPTYSLRRGDDQVYATPLSFYKQDGSPMAFADAVGLGMAMAGRYGNPAKQKTGDWGVPILEFASKVYTAKNPEGETPPARSIVRSLTSETGGVDPSFLSPVTGGEVPLPLGLVSDTMTAKSRIMPLRGGPHGDATAGNEHIVKYIADLDKFGLTYGELGYSDDQLQELLMAEARRYSAREARKHNLMDVDVNALLDEYIDSSLHFLLRRFWSEGRSNRTSRKGAALGWWEGVIDDATKQK